jgi:phytoene dehydrogenase-like protein
LKTPITDIKGAIFNLDPVVIGRFPSNIDPLRAPAGKQLSTWLRPISYPVSREKIKEAEGTLRAMIEKIFPGFFNLVEWERKLVHPVMDGLSMKPGQDFPQRPSPLVSSIPNLFLAGDTIQGKGSGGDIAFSSALTASGLIIEYLNKSNS